MLVMLDTSSHIDKPAQQRERTNRTSPPGNLSSYTADCYSEYQRHRRTNYVKTNIRTSRGVMMDPGAVRMLCFLLHPHTKVLEWGSGGSTKIFSRYVAEWWSLEHDTEWGAFTLWELARVPWGGRVHLEVIPPDFLTRALRRRDGTGQEFSNYVERPASYDRQFDVIVDDGRARVAVARSVVRNRLLAPGGVVVVHDWQRREYK